MIFANDKKKNKMFFVLFIVFCLLIYTLLTKNNNKKTKHINKDNKETNKNNKEHDNDNDNKEHDIRKHDIKEQDIRKHDIKEQDNKENSMDIKKNKDNNKKEKELIDKIKQLADYMYTNESFLELLKKETNNIHNLMPKNVIEMNIINDGKNTDIYKLLFQVENKNKINNDFILSEFKTMEKHTYAYTVLLFPSYLPNGEIVHRYLLGAILVAHMLKNRFQNYDLYKNKINGTKADVICMVTPDINNNIIDILKLFYDYVITVPYISWSDYSLSNEIINDQNKFIRIEDLSKGNLNKSHGFCKVMTKLNIFNSQLLKYKKIVLLDADIIPLGFYDTLFTLETPAGWLEFRHHQMINLGIDPTNDRSTLCIHSQKILPFLTDLNNKYSSDINASILVIEPNINLFNEMINELKTPLDKWFGNNKEHSGFWYMDKFYDHYKFPEQNYLTKKFSGKWKCIDVVYSKWIKNANDSLGISLAGVVEKPWEIQSINHMLFNEKDTVFSVSDCIQEGNERKLVKIVYYIINTYIFDVFLKIHTEKNYKFMKDAIMKNNLKLIPTFINPWIKSNEQNYFDFNSLPDKLYNNLSNDQLKILYLLNNNNDKSKIKGELYYKYLENKNNIIKL